LEKEYGQSIRHYEGLPSRIEQLEETIERLDSDGRDVRRRYDVLSEEMAVQLAANRLLVKERDTAIKEGQNAEKRHSYTKETLSRLQTRLEAHEKERTEKIGTIQRLNDIIAGLQGTVLEQNDEITRLKAHIGTIEGQLQLERAKKEPYIDQFGNVDSNPEHFFK
jgi:chromosome segregation ATPase